MTYDLCSWCDGDGDDGCGWHCLRCEGSGMVEVYGDPDGDGWDDGFDDDDFERAELPSVGDDSRPAQVSKPGGV